MSHKFFALITIVATALTACASPAPTPTPTPVPPTATSTPTATATAIPPTSTPLPTATAIPPTATATATPIPPTPTLKPIGKVEGTVRGSDGKPAAGMRLTLTDWLNAKNIAETTTDNNGHYSFDAVPPGGYVVAWVITRPTLFFDGTNPFDVKAGVTTQVNIVLP